MNKYMRYVLFIILYVDFSYAVQFTISTPGLVELGENITFSPTASNDAVIEITSSDVTLDLGNRVIGQSNSTAGLTGIRVASNLSNITIRNGTVTSLTGTGVVVNERCSNIEFSNVHVLSCAGRGIEFLTTGANPTEDCKVDGCRIITVSQVGLFVGSGSTNINVSNCFFDQAGSGSSAILLDGAATTRITKCNIIDTFIARCGSGVTLNNCDNCLVNNVKVLNGSSTTTYDGIAVVGTSGNQANGNIIQNCMIENCTSAGGAVAGIRVSQAGQTILSNCFIRFEQSSNATVRGYYFLGSSSDSLIENCVANQVRGTALAGGSVFGFHFDTNTNSAVRSCQCIDTTVDGGPATAGDGFRFDTCGCFTIEDCQSGDNNQDGFNVVTGTDMLVIDCESFCNTRNGFTADGGSDNVFENCAALSNTTAGFSTDGTSHVARLSKAVTNGTGFTIVTGSTAGVWSDNVASGNTTGFNNDGTSSSIVGNKAMNNTTGFANAAGGGSTAVLNQAAQNTTNYSAMAPITQGPTASATMGSNLTI